MKTFFAIIVFLCYVTVVNGQFYTPGHAIQTTYGDVTTPGHYNNAYMHYGVGAVIYRRYGRQTNQHVVSLYVVYVAHEI